MGFPQIRPVAEHAVLVEFGSTIDTETHEQVLHLDEMLVALPPDGFRESVPAYVNLLVEFDPLVTDHSRISLALQKLIATPKASHVHSAEHVVEICYDTDLAPDLTDVANRTGLSPDAVVNAHLAGDYRVFLYGFAPGYAYLGGVPTCLQLPRKETAVRGVAAGSVIIAGPQCIVTTLTMPTGWWIIGRSPTRILRDDPARPFLFDIADRVRFSQISRSDFDRASQ